VPSRGLRPRQERTAEELCRAGGGREGPGRLQELRNQAAKRGLDLNVWFKNVELIAAEKISRETVTYVSNIYKHYLAYKMITDQREEREKARQAVKQDAGK
jgi:membrane-bound lytic murein transglycosylase MltF